MGRARNRTIRLVAAIIGVALAWSLVAWVAGPADGQTWSATRSQHPSIEPPEVLVAIVADRPPTTRHERGGALRVVPALVSELSSSSPLPRLLIGDVGFPATPFTTVPLAFGLARRGPPASVGR